MKIDFAAQLRDGDDKVIIENDAPAAVKEILKRAVLADVTPQGQPVPAEEKVKRFDLFLKLRSADETTDFTLDEVQLLDKAVLVFPTLIAGQLHYLLSHKSG